MGPAVVKGHAYGNDFLMVSADGLRPRADVASLAALARDMCHRHEGLGADGLIGYTFTPDGAAMRLWNADGSAAELSGNGLRCLAAFIARTRQLGVGDALRIETGAGVKALELLAVEGRRYTFRAAMGVPEDLRQMTIRVGADAITASVLRLGNPQCVVLGPLPDAATFDRLGPALATHALFPSGTNVEFAQVETPGRVRILIWERGVGPTTSSGTGASASAVAAAAFSGASRDVEVVAPGGAQRVEWRDDGVYLTGWAELVFDGHWLREA